MRQMHDLMLDAVQEERTNAANQRNGLNNGAKGAVAGAVALAAVGGPAFNRMMAAAQFDSDIDVLNFALTLEHLEYAFYRDGLIDFGPQAFASAGYADVVFPRLEVARDHELAHVQTLSQVITDLGGAPVQEAVYDFGYSNIGGFIAVAAALENTGVSAYDGAARFIQNNELVAAAGTIVAIEARHASYLNLLNGELPFPDAFETPLSRDEVLGIAGQFIVS